MWPTLLDLGAIKVTIFGISLVVGFGLGSFIMWRRLREDYDAEKLLTLWLWLVVAAWVGSGVWAWWSEVWRQLYGVVALPVLVLAWWSKRFKWNFWELLDTFAPVTLAMAVVAAAGWGPKGVLTATVAAAGVVLVAALRRVYRQWRWYKSGKVGLVGIIALAWWAVVNLVIANFRLWAVYSLGWTVIVALVAAYLRAGRVLQDDLTKLWPSKKRQLPKR